VAEETGTEFIDLQELIAVTYETMDSVKANAFFPADRTHTNKEGAVLNAEQVVAGIKQLHTSQLKKFLNR